MLRAIRRYSAVSATVISSGYSCRDRVVGSMHYLWAVSLADRDGGRWLVAGFLNLPARFEAWEIRSSLLPPQVHRDLRLCLTFFVDEIDRSGRVIFGSVCSGLVVLGGRLVLVAVACKYWTTPIYCSYGF